MNISNMEENTRSISPNIIQVLVFKIVDGLTSLEKNNFKSLFDLLLNFGLFVLTVFGAEILRINLNLFIFLSNFIIFTSIHNSFYDSNGFLKQHLIREFIFNNHKISNSVKKVLSSSLLLIQVYILISLFKIAAIFKTTCSLSDELNRISSFSLMSLGIAMISLVLNISFITIPDFQKYYYSDLNQQSNELQGEVELNDNWFN